GDLRPGGGNPGDHRRLAGVGKADEADVREQLQMQPQVFFFTGKSELELAGRAVGGGHVLRVAVTAKSAPGDDHARPIVGQIRDLHVDAVLVPLVHDSAGRHLEV